MGCEITATAWMALRGDSNHCFCLISDAGFMEQRLAAAGLAIPLRRVNAPDEAADCFAEALPVLHRPLGAKVRAGQFSKDASPWVLAAIEEAVDLCLAEKASGFVTNPIQKEALYAAGFAFQGHTDFLGHIARQRGHAAQDVMMLVGEGLRAIPVTVHIALKDVPNALTRAAIELQARVVHGALQRFFGIAKPRLAVTGLNPHAGENGNMGREEIETIIPAIAKLKAQGLDVRGPLPADTAFFPEARETYDAILCMYHDQALIPVKTLDFHGGVNVTLGLPFIRTSPDHGTALALAGTGKARHQSLVAAITLARDMAAASRS